MQNVEVNVGYYLQIITSGAKAPHNATSDMKNLINIRVLQHDTNDQIRIGMAYPIIDLDKAEKDIIDNYEKKTAWCGGFKAACEKYYQRIAIVRADTLEVIRPIYPNK